MKIKIKSISIPNKNGIIPKWFPKNFLRGVDGNAPELRYKAMGIRTFSVGQTLIPPEHMVFKEDKWWATAKWASGIVVVGTDPAPSAACRRSAST